VNERIRVDAEVRVDETSYDEAVRKGALAFFGDKYGDTVRVVKIGDFSTELCGGTHVHRSGEIGIFKLHAEGGVAAGVRRVEAVTGEGALDLIRTDEQRLKEIGALTRSGADETVDRVKKLLQQQKELEREIETLRGQQGKNQLPELLAKKQQVNGATVVVSKVERVDANQLRELADQLKEKMGSGLVFLVSAGDANVTMVASVTKDLTARYHAGNIVKQVAPIVGGGGGGRPDFAQAGGKEPAKVDEAVDKVWQIVKSTHA
jgi:alanyl-tRNA synthetase